MSRLKEYEICKADPEEWSRYHAIYRLTNFNEWMSLSFQGDIDRYNKLDICYWIMKNDKRVGGALIKPNLIKCIFVISPFNNKEEIIKAITLYANSISDTNEYVVISDADLRAIEFYESAGFEIDRVEKLMVCPTKSFDVVWDERYKVIAPEEKYIDEMAELYYESYGNSKLQYNASTTYDVQLQSVNVYFNHRASMNVPRDYSTLVFDSVSNKLVGACTVSLVNKLPYILDFVVHAEYQRQGLALNIMKTTLDRLASAYPAIRLNVVVGNDAEVFYDKMGFVSLAEKG